jgi:hypothetical protein
MAYIHQTFAANAGGFSLLKDYEVLDLANFKPGSPESWKKLYISQYYYIDDPDHSYPHAYKIQDNILEIEHLYDSMFDPTYKLENKLDFTSDEDIPGVLFFAKDPKTKPVQMTLGVYEGRGITDSSNHFLDPVLVSCDYQAEYQFKYRICYDVHYQSVQHLVIADQGLEDPALEVDVDFILTKDEYAQYIHTKFKFPIIDLLISKANFRANRIANEFGNLFGWSREDSTFYRDNLVALSALFYQGPTIKNIVAGLSSVMSLPLIKYGNERLVRYNNRYAITDKYRYNIYGSHVGLSSTTNAKFNDQISDAFELLFHKTHPNWWVNRTPALFQKYAEQTLTHSSMNTMMDMFLKGYVANARVDLEKIDTYAFGLDSEIMEVYRDGWPTNLDIILSAYRDITDIDDEMISVPDLDFIKQKIGLLDYMENTFNPIVKPNPRDWYVGSKRYRLLSSRENQKQFYSDTHEDWPYFEPNFDRWWWKISETSELDGKYKYTGLVDNTLWLPETQKKKWKEYPELYSDMDESGGIGISDGFDSLGITLVKISSDYSYSVTDFRAWDLDNCVVGVKGILGPLNSTYKATSTETNIGIIPKNIKLDLVAEVPFSTSIKYTYSVNNSEFLDIPEDLTINSVHGKIKYRVEMKSSGYASPTFKYLNMTITID